MDTRYFEEYEVKDVIQTTLMGYVALVEDCKGHTYAAKITASNRKLRISAEDPNTEQVVYRALSQQSHPNLLCVLRVFEFDNQYVSILPLARGDLLEYLPEWSRIQLFFCQLLDAMDHFHNVLHMEHGDLSLENILVFDDGVRICDYGQAMRIGSQRLAGECRGKHNYAAPELNQSGIVDGKSDVFSLGVVLFCMIAHCELFEMASYDNQKYRFVQSCDMNKFEKLWVEWKLQEVPAHVKWLILNMTRHDPAERSSIVEIKEWVNKFGLE